MASTTKAHHRIFALLGAILFLGTSIAFSVLVLIQMHQSEQSNPQKNQQTTNQSEDTLEGKKLDNFTPVSQVDTLQVIDLKEGTGEAVKAGATVTAHYTGALAKDGTIFESSKDSGQPATFPLSNVIEGWQQGVPGMKVGGIRRLIIPSALAYKEEGSPPKIGPNEPLVFDIELISIDQ